MKKRRTEKKDAPSPRPILDRFNLPSKQRLLFWEYIDERRLAKMRQELLQMRIEELNILIGALRAELGEDMKSAENCGMRGMLGRSDKALLEREEGTYFNPVQQ